MKAEHNPEVARVERRFGLSTLMVATFFFAVLFAFLKLLALPWFITVAVIVFLVGIAIAQMPVKDAKKVRLVSMLAGLVLYPLCLVVARYFAAPFYFFLGPFFLPDPRDWISTGISGTVAGYFGGVLVAGIFLVARYVEGFFARPQTETEEPWKIVTLEPGMPKQSEIVRSVDQVRAAVHAARVRGLRVGLVPTMGALHEGHLSLIRRARAESGFVVVSIFVNPAQFGPHEDLSRYPRPFDEDMLLCCREGVDLVFAPEADTVYPAGFSSFVEVAGLSSRLEGTFRPGHFRGVATVVLKLFHIVEPDIAYFGQKDAQQARVIQQMVHDLNVPVEIRVCPTVRELDGLALSSRNVYLNEADRQRALALSRCLHAAKELIDAGERDANSVRQKMRSVLESAEDVVPDYAELVDPITFEPVQQIAGTVLAVVAARVGKTRLIDNLPIEVRKS